MYLAELLMQNELAVLNSELESGNRHINDLRSGEYDFYNDGAVTRLQNKIYRIIGDLKDLHLESYLAGLQEIGRSISRFKEQESLYHGLLMNVDRDLTLYRNSIARYVKSNFGCLN